MGKIVLLAMTLAFLNVTAQKTVSASDIMDEIKKGKDISYKNVTIDGIVDFTYMDEALEKLPEKRKRSWWGNNNYSNKAEKLIDVKLSFENCTFKEDILAYIPDEDSGYTFIASFEKEAIFKNCKFEGKAMFKYSTFEKNSDFSGSEFQEDSTFKYAKFDRTISFENTKFDEIATFKYAKFNNKVSFANSVFEDSAVFKYTNFNNGVSFENTNFEEDLNIKYMKVNGEFNISKMKVAYSIDSKYTKINGKGFNKYLLDRD